MCGKFISLTGHGVTNHVAETLATLCKVQHGSVVAGLTGGSCKPLFICRGITSSSTQLMSPKGKTPSSSRWLKRQMKVCTIMCVSSLLPPFPGEYH